MFLLSALFQSSPYVSEVDKKFKYLISSRPIGMSPKNLRYDKQYMLHRFFTDSIQGSDLSKLEKKTSTMPFYTGNLHNKKEGKRSSILKNPLDSSSDRSINKKSKPRKPKFQVELITKLELPENVVHGSSSSESEDSFWHKIRRKPKKKMRKSNPLDRVGSCQAGSIDYDELAYAEPHKSRSKSHKSTEIETSESATGSPGINEIIGDNETESTIGSSKFNGRSRNDKSLTSGENSRIIETENSNKSGSRTDEKKDAKPSRSQEIIKLLDQTYSPFSLSSLQSNSITVPVSHSGSISNPTSCSNPATVSYIGSVSDPNSFSNQTVVSNQTYSSSKVDQGTQSDLSGTGKNYDTSDFQSEFPENKTKYWRSKLNNISRTQSMKTSKSRTLKSQNTKSPVARNRTTNDTNKSSIEKSGNQTSPRHKYLNGSSDNSCVEPQSKSVENKPSREISAKYIRPSSRSKISNYTNHSNSSNNSKGDDLLDIDETQQITISEIIKIKKNLDGDDKNVDISPSEKLDGEMYESRKMKAGRMESEANDKLQWEVYPIKQNSETSANNSTGISENFKSEIQDPQQSETSTHFVFMSGNADNSERRFKNKISSESRVRNDITTFLMEAQKYDSAPSVVEYLKISSGESLSFQRQAGSTRGNTSISTFSTYPTSLSTRRSSSQALTAFTTDCTFSEISLGTDVKDRNSSTSRKSSPSETTRKILSEVFQSKNKICKVSSFTDASSRSHVSHDDLRLHPCPSATNLSTPSNSVDKHGRYDYEYQKAEENSEKNSFVGSSMDYTNAIPNINQRIRYIRKLSRSPLRRIFKPFITSSDETVISDSESKGSMFASDSENVAESNETGINQETGKPKHNLIIPKFQSQPIIKVVSKNKSQKNKSGVRMKSLPITSKFKTQQSVY